MDDIYCAYIVIKYCFILLYAIFLNILSIVRCNTKILYNSENLILVIVVIKFLN